MGLSVAHVPAEFIEKLAALWAARDSLSGASLGIGLLTMGLIVALRRAVPRFPGLIVAVAVSSALVALFNLPVDTIEGRFGALPRNLPLPALPEITYERVIALLPSALVIAFLAGWNRSCRPSSPTG